MYQQFTNRETGSATVHESVQNAVQETENIETFKKPFTLALIRSREPLFIRFESHFEFDTLTGKRKKKSRRRSFLRLTPPHPSETCSGKNCSLGQKYPPVVGHSDKPRGSERDSRWDVTIISFHSDILNPLPPPTPLTPSDKQAAHTEADT